MQFILVHWEVIVEIAFMVAAFCFAIVVVSGIVILIDRLRNRKLSPDSQHTQDVLTDFYAQQQARQAAVSRAMAPETLNGVYIASETLKRTRGRQKGSTYPFGPTRHVRDASGKFVPKRR